MRSGIVAAIALAACLACAALEANAAETARRPNVVIILMDDLGYGDIASYGATDMKTPNLDRLAREGVRFTDAYANGPVCSPTRAALISGRYQQRSGIEWVLADLPEDRERGLPVTGTSLPALLDRAGYVTGLVGKWHLGFKPELGPNAQGFTEFFGFRAGALDFYSHTRGDGTPDLYENTAPIKSSRYLTDELSQRAVSFIDRHASAPFFLEVAYNAPHWPFEPPDLAPTDPRRKVPHPEFEGDRRISQMPDDSTPATRTDYVRMVERADVGIGNILAALDRHGLAANTLVIFTSDNGGEWLSRNAPFFHRKNSLWEGGIRVPLILRWPARLPAGKVSEQPAITMDLNASILAASGATLPDGYRPDGIDLIPALAGESAPTERQLFWRLARPDRQQKAVRAGQWKLLIDSGQYFLFDLKADPTERNDQSAQRPELVSKLKALLANWEQDVDRSAAAAASGKI
jgi:arylsulfatase A-like enzyme